MMTFERSKRGLYAINQQLPNTKQNSVHDYLQKWCRGGSYGWVLDNVEDQIDLSQGRLFGFDDTAFLEDKDILAPVTMSVSYTHLDVYKRQGFTHALLKRLYILKAFKKNSPKTMTKP